MTENIVNYEIQIFDSITEIAVYFSDFLKNNVELANNKFSLVLSGGSTPKPVYKYLAEQNRNKLDWNKINFFWGDERCVPQDDVESNYKMVYDTLLNKINIHTENIFRIQGEDDPYTEAKRYSDVILKNVISSNRFPRFDLMLLGLGEDGHVASIFPDQLNLFEENEICKVSIHPTTKQKRITLTGKVINNSENIIFIVTGENKSKVLNDILMSHENSIKYPANYVKPTNGRLIWLLDKAAGKKLNSSK